MLPFTLNLEFPESVTALFQILGYVNILKTASPQCSLIYRFTFFDSMVLRTTVNPVKHPRCICIMIYSCCTLYYKGVIYSIIMIFIYSIGITLFEYWNLRKVERDETYKHNDENPVSFLVSSYRVPRYLCWDIIETRRRLIMTAVLSVLGTGRDYVVVGVGLSVLFIWLCRLFSIPKFQISSRANIFVEYMWGASSSLNISILIINI